MMAPYALPPVAPPAIVFQVASRPCEPLVIDFPDGITIITLCGDWLEQEPEVLDPTTAAGDATLTVEYQELGDE